MNENLAGASPADQPVRLPPDRAAFEAFAKEHRPDLDLRYMYDAQGNYHYDGYIWAETADALRMWRAAAAAERERCKLVVQRAQYRNGHHTHEGTTMGHYDVRMIAGIESGHDPRA